MINIIRIGRKNFLWLISLAFSLQSCLLARIFSISSNSSFKSYFDPLSHSKDFLASSIRLFFAYHIGDSGKNKVATVRNRQHGKVATWIRILNGKMAARTNETATNKALFKMFIIDNIPLNRIRDISLKYIFVVGTAIPTPAPIRHLAISNQLELKHIYCVTKVMWQIDENYL